ncbi:hypothetical protein [Algoriphagus zhangzhouensis]|nr:hypothetical protein [Algoriphagus zhangzhouensis]
MEKNTIDPWRIVKDQFSKSRIKRLPPSFVTLQMRVSENADGD